MKNENYQYTLEGQDSYESILKNENYQYLFTQPLDLHQILICFRGCTTHQIRRLKFKMKVGKL